MSAIWENVGASSTILLLMPVNCSMNSGMRVSGLTRVLHSLTLPSGIISMMPISVMRSCWGLVPVVSTSRQATGRSNSIHFLVESDQPRPAVVNPVIFGRCVAGYHIDPRCIVLVRQQSMVRTAIAHSLPFKLVFYSKTNLDYDLVVGNLAIDDMSTCFNYFKPVQVLDSKRSFGNRISYCVISTDC